MGPAVFCGRFAGARPGLVLGEIGRFRAERLLGGGLIAPRWSPLPADGIPAAQDGQRLRVEGDR